MTHSAPLTPEPANRPKITVPDGECQFGDCTHPSTVTAARRRPCGHHLSPVEICYCCSRRRTRAERPSTCNTCGKQSHLTSY